MEEKNIKKQNIINAIILVFIFLLLIFIFDLILYSVDWIRLKKEHDKTGSHLPEFNYSLSLSKIPYKHLTDISIFRKPLNTSSNLDPIYIFGCSFAYGERLKENETFSAKLAECTKRPVYNFASVGLGIQHMLYYSKEPQLTNLLNKMGTSEKNPPKYVIYVYIHDHLRRMHSDFFLPSHNLRYLKYKKLNGKLKLKQNSIFNFEPYTFKKISCLYADFVAKSNFFRQQNFNLLEQHFVEINKNLKSKFPNTEFIILIYCPTKIELSYDWKRLNKYGIKTYFTSDLTEENLNDKEFTFPDSHPNAKAWEFITPLFIEKAGIY